MTNACVGDTSPSKHETVRGTAYRGLAGCTFLIEERIPVDERARPVIAEGRAAHEAWLLLAKYKNCNKSVWLTLNFDQPNAG